MGDGWLETQNEWGYSPRDHFCEDLGSAWRLFEVMGLGVTVVVIELKAYTVSTKSHKSKVGDINLRDGINTIQMWMSKEQKATSSAGGSTKTV